MWKKFSERKLGRVPEAIGVMWHNRPVLKTLFEFGGKSPTSGMPATSN
jgi:hypothetical protein